MDRAHRELLRSGHNFVSSWRDIVGWKIIKIFLLFLKIIHFKETLLGVCGAGFGVFQFPDRDSGAQHERARRGGLISGPIT